MPNINEVLIIGLGAQGYAWAQNLSDSGWSVKLALRTHSPSTAKAHQHDWPVLELGAGPLTNAQNILLLTPDHTHQDFLKQYQAWIPQGSRIIYAHGFSYSQYKFNQSYPQWEHLLLAPKAIASEVRNKYLIKGNLGGVYSLEAALDPNTGAWLKSLGQALGLTHLYEVQFQQEATADLFSEQSVLCSLLPYGALLSFERLRKAGIPAELAYMECWVELKLIVDTMVKLGPLEFFKLISPNALMGGEKARELIFDKEYQKHLDKLLSDIQTGAFAQQCEQADFAAIKQKVLKRWEQTELAQLHQELKL